MRFLSLSLQNFRNAELLHWRDLGPMNYILGANGQGKTNLLEALGFITALRSFRTSEIRALKRWGCRQLQLVYRVEHSRLGEVEVDILVRSSGKEVRLDGEKINRFADFVGLFPVVAMSSQDIQLLRGAPAPRRKFFDLLFSATDASYYKALRQYTQALNQRNALLKQEAPDALFSAYENVLAESAEKLTALRGKGIEKMAKLLEQTYATFAPSSEPPSLAYHAAMESSENGSRQDWAAFFREGRARDRKAMTTHRGPHREDFPLRLQNRDARLYASEGQQRGLVLALRIAQAVYFSQALGESPVILADDILNELDDQRRQFFWETMRPDWQVFATGTRKPEGANKRDWVFHSIREGKLELLS